MNWDIYCDESRHELFGRLNGDDSYIVLGSLWLPRSEREDVKKQIQTLRMKHGVWAEFKWTKLSPAKYSFYMDLLELFFDSPNLRFRTIAIKTSTLDMEKYNQNDSDLGYYKFFYQLLHHRIEPGNTYRVFLDFRSAAVSRRNSTLQRALGAANKRSHIEQVQSIRSSDSDFIQFCDLLLGATQARLNHTNSGSASKSGFVEKIEEKLGRQLARTSLSETKFNIFEIRLR